MKQTRSDDAVLLAAISGRALAQSARRGGYRPLVVDFFGDQDTAAAAEAHVRVDGDFTRGFGERELFAALECLAAQHPPIGIVCGTGFEDRPQLLAQIAQRWHVYGNGADDVARVKDPQVLAALCRSCGVPFPDVWLQRPACGRVLAKRRGGSGGAHIANHEVANHEVANHGGVAAPALASARRSDIYYQARVPGRPVSALLLANANGAIVLGFSAQWASPTPAQPFRYGGAVRPAGIPPHLALRLEAAACRLAAAASLRGLNSADFMVDGDDFWVIEINPRQGATLDIFETDGSATQGPSLLSLHMAACAGDLIDVAPRRHGARASAVSYAAHDVVAAARFAWPSWCADRPGGGLAIRAGEPLCTVHADAATAADAKALADERLALVHSWTQEWAGREGRRP